jgi:type II secretory pathway component GspD/PulD (secretin)
VAEIFAGETVPVVITSLQSRGAAGGTLQSVQLEKIDVGKLVITPRLTEDGMITVLVQPEVSRILKFVGPDADLPQTSTRRAQTRSA